MAEIMTAEESVKNRIRRILIDSLELDLKEDEIEDGVNFDELFGLDSIAVIEFVIALEKEFDITIESERLTSSSLKNFDGLSAYIEKLTGRKNRHK
jgi:acyl carrier protein